MSTAIARIRFLREGTCLVSGFYHWAGLVGDFVRVTEAARTVYASALQASIYSGRQRFDFDIFPGKADSAGGPTGDADGGAGRVEAAVPEAAAKAAGRGEREPAADRGRGGGERGAERAEPEQHCEQRGARPRSERARAAQRVRLPLPLSWEAQPADPDARELVLAFAQ